MRQIDSADKIVIVDRYGAEVGVGGEVLYIGFGHWRRGLQRGQQGMLAVDRPVDNLVGDVLLRGCADREHCKHKSRTSGYSFSFPPK